MTALPRARVQGAILAALLMAAWSPDRRARPSDHQSALAEAVDHHLERLSEYGFSGGVVLERGGEIVLARGYGLADRERRTPMTEHTPVYVASVSKMFIAAAVLKLVDAGRLSLEDRLGSVLEGTPQDKREITLHLLMTHHSGLGGEDLEIDGISRREFVRLVLSRPLGSTPGTAYEYSNDGYGLLAAIVEQVSGRPFAEFVRMELFEPAGMHDTVWITAAPPSWRSRARAYRGERPMGDLLATERRPYGWCEFSGRGVLTSAWDLHLWHRALADRRVLSGSAMDARIPPRPRGQGLGLNGGLTARGTFQYGHGGLYLPDGWNASFRELPDDGGFIAVVSNAYSGRSLGEYAANAADALLFGGLLVVPAPTAPCRDIEPHESPVLFRTARGATFRTVVDFGSLMLEPENQRALNLLLFESEDEHPELTRANDLAIKTVLAAQGNLPDSQRERLEALRDRLEHRFGPIHGQSALSVPSLDEAGIIESFVRLQLRDESAVVRVISRDGAPMRVSGLDSYGSESFELEHRGGRIRLTCPSSSRFAAFDFVTEKGRSIAVERLEDGSLASMRFRSSAGETVAYRLRKVAG